MSRCDNCRLRKESAKAFDIHWMGEDDCPYEKCPVPKFHKTNADRIRSMTDEELADELVEWFACFSAVEWTREMICDWLKQECEE